MISVLPDDHGDETAVAKASGKRLPMISMVFFGVIMLIALIGPRFVPHDPEIGALSARLLPPSWMEAGQSEYLLGTDTLGRDILSRLIVGTRLSLMVAFAAVIASSVFGTFLGVVAGYYGGKMDTLLMRVTDVGLAIPVILMAIILVALLGASVRNVVLTVVVLLWPFYARQVRSETSSIVKQEYVDLAKVAGLSTVSIVRRHVLPNLVPTLLVLSTLQIALVVLLEASLSFLGVGIPPPTPAWGLMVADGRDLISTAWWISVMPGIAIFLTVLSANLLGDWLRDRFDPKLEHL